MVDALEAFLNTPEKSKDYSKAKKEFEKQYEDFAISFSDLYRIKNKGDDDCNALKNVLLRAILKNPAANNKFYASLAAILNEIQKEKMGPYRELEARVRLAQEAVNNATQDKKPQLELKLKALKDELTNVKDGYVAINEYFSKARRIFQAPFQLVQRELIRQKVFEFVTDYSGVQDPAWLEGKVTQVRNTVNSSNALDIGDLKNPAQLTAQQDAAAFFAKSFLEKY